MKAIDRRICNAHNRCWRDPLQVISFWEDARKCDKRLLKFKTEGNWSSVLLHSARTLLVTREYEHLIMGLSTDAGKLWQSWMRIAHPSGIAVDQRTRTVCIASTRSPNQVFFFKYARPVSRSKAAKRAVLIPTATQFYPGSLYLHDLAFLHGELYGNAVGENTVVRLEQNGSYTRVWWPTCVERKDKPLTEKNYLQLNSMALHGSMRESFFTASSERVLDSVPGDVDFPVDGRGVVFSGRTRKPIVSGLTRPHSARFHKGKLWLLNSGYGELGSVRDGRFCPLLKLPGWTRGLHFVGDIAFVGTSTILPRFRQYAPGLKPRDSICGVHAVDIRKGRLLASLIWPYGNQIFGIESLRASECGGFPFQVSRRCEDMERELFFRYQMVSED